MKTVLILILTVAFTVRAKCECNSAFGYEILATNIDQIYSNLKAVQLWSKKSEQQISTLQAQLKNKTANLERLERQVLLLSEASVRNEKEIKQLKSNQKVQLDLQKKDEHQTTTFESQKKSEEQISTSEVQEENEQQLIDEKFCATQNKSAVHSKDYKWVSWTSNNTIPDNAVSAGDQMYVARSRYNGANIVGKVDLRHKRCYVPFGSKELEQNECEILTGTQFSWEYSDVFWPDNAFPGGWKADGKLLYIGRVEIYNKMQGRYELASGSIDGISKLLSIPFGGEAYEYYKFDVLVRNNTNWLQLLSNEKAQLQFEKKDEQQTAMLESQLVEEDPCLAQNGLALTSSEYKWVSWTKNTTFPNYTISYGDQQYVARIKHNGEFFFGRAIPNYQGCFIHIRDKASYYIEAFTECEILTGSRFSWVRYSGGTWPTNAFPGTQKANGDLVYIGRVYADLYSGLPKQNAQVWAGSIDGKLKILSVSNGNEALKYTEFDVLVMNINSNTTKI